MRLDKYLKITRLIKRRTVAKEIADQGRIAINNKIGKSSSVVNVDDILTIKYGNKILKIKIKDIKETTKKDEAIKLFEIIEEQYLED